MASGQWAVRPARETDAAQIASVHVRSWQRAYRGLIPDHVLDALDVDQRAERWKTTLNDPGETAVLLAVQPLGEPGGELGAFCMVGPVRAAADTTHSQPGVGEMYGLYADPDAFGSGAGRAAHDAGVALRWAVGDRQIVLWVLTGNDRARSFYARNGWQCDGLIESHVHAAQTMQVVRYSLPNPLL